MLRRLASHAPQAGATRDELALLASLGESDELAPIAWLTRDDALCEGELAEALGEATVVVLVRTEATVEGAFTALVLAAPSADPQLVRDVSSSCAEACYGVSSSRFASHLAPNADAEAIDATLVRLSAASGGAALPPPSLARVSAVVELARARSRGAAVVIQPLPRAARFGSVLSRDPRTGSGPARASLASSPRALFDARPADRPLAELDLPASERERLERALRQLEARAQRPVRVALIAEGDRARIAGVQPLRRSGVAAFAIAHELVDAGALTHQQALQLLQPADVLAAVSMRLEVDPAAVVTTGIAAGSGIGEGFVCLDPAAALELHAAGLPAILFVHDVLPEDIPAIQSAAGVVAVRGGLTGEAALMARGFSRPCVASGAGLSLAEGAVRVTGGDALKPGQRITIDGATGLIVRGAAALAIGEPSPPVAAVLGWLAEPQDRGVTAIVDCAEHVLTAHRLGARALVVARPEILLYEALHEERELEAALVARARTICAAAEGKFSRLRVCALAPDWQLPLASPRPVSAEERRALQRAWQACTSTPGLELVLEVAPDASEVATWVPAGRVLAARIERGRDA